MCVGPFLHWAFSLFIAAGALAVTKMPAVSFCFASLLSGRFWEGGAGAVRGPPV